MVTGFLHSSHVRSRWVCCSPYSLTCGFLFSSLISLLDGSAFLHILKHIFSPFNLTCGVCFSPYFFICQILQSPFYSTFWVQVTQHSSTHFLLLLFLVCLSPHFLTCCASLPTVFFTSPLSAQLSTHLLFFAFCKLLSNVPHSNGKCSTGPHTRKTEGHCH